MKLRRRRFLQLVSSAVLWPAAPYVARAQSGYPNRPVRIIVGQAAGSSSDIAARLIGQWLSEKTGGQFVVETRPGAAGNIATEFVAHSPGDGYTLLLVNAQNTINATLYDKPGFDFQRDIVPVAGFNRVMLVMEVNPSFPAKTVPEFIAYAKANPGKVNMASAGIGGPQHAAGEMFKYLAGVNLVHVPYRGSTPAITDLIGGQVQVMFDAMISTLPQIQSGKIRALAVTAATRSAMLPNVPAIAETVPGYEAIIWYGVGVPRGTPTVVVAKLNREINAGLTSTKMRSQLSELGSTPIIATPDEFWAFARSETEKWEKVIRQSGAKID